MYHPIVFKFSWLIVLDKETTWCKFQGRRLKVKVTRRQPWKICCTLISLLFFERISVKLGWYIGSITSTNPMNFQVCTPNVMVTVRQNNSSIHPTYFCILLFIATISQDLFNPCPWMFRPRIRLMGHPMPQLRAKADLPVGFPYRFNSRK